MVETLGVSISGFTFSLLLYENLKSEYDQEGFLLGEIVTTEKSTVTDADQEVVKIERIIRIKSVLPCPQQCYFYNQAGKVDFQKLEELLASNANKVVAWYKYKKINPKLTLREKIVHKGLMNFFGSDLFTMCILMNNCSDNLSTHSFSQTFIRYSDDYHPVPLHIINLSQKNDCYKMAEPLPKEFNNIVNSLKLDLENTQGVVIANKIQEAVQKHIDHLVSNLNESEKELFELEEEVRQLKQNLKWKRQYNFSVESNFDSDVINGADDIMCSNYTTNETVTNISEKRTRNKGPKSAKKSSTCSVTTEGGWIQTGTNKQSKILNFESNEQ